MKKTFYLLAFVLFSIGFTSCSKDDGDVDPRDQYVGQWNMSSRGSLTIFHLGQAAGTVPINEQSQTTISKHGDSDLKIDDMIFYFNGNRLSADSQSITLNQDGITMVGTAIYSGTTSSEIITINSEITGSWSDSYGAHGEFSGSIVHTLTK